MDQEKSNNNICQICFTEIPDASETTTCPKCQINFHRECWEEYGGCSVYGCEYAPEAEKSEVEEEFTQARWGQDTKNCPFCGEEIPISETECPFCHEKFKSADPVKRTTLYEKKKKRVPSAAVIRGTIVFFALSVVGIFFIFMIPAIPFWFNKYKKEYGEENPLYKLLLWAGWGFSVLYGILFFAAVIKLSGN